MFCSVISTSMSLLWIQAHDFPLTERVLYTKLKRQWSCLQPDAVRLKILFGSLFGPVLGLQG